MKNVLQQVLLVYALISHNDHQLPSFKLMGATQKLFEYVFPIVARHLISTALPSAQSVRRQLKSLRVVLVTMSQSRKSY